MKIWIELNGEELSIRLACATCQDCTPSAMFSREIVCAKCQDSRADWNWTEIIRQDKEYKSIVPEQRYATPKNP